VFFLLQKLFPQVFERWEEMDTYVSTLRFSTITRIAFFLWPLLGAFWSKFLGFNQGCLAFGALFFLLNGFGLYFHFCVFPGIPGLDGNWTWCSYAYEKIISTVSLVFLITVFIGYVFINLVFPKTEYPGSA
jgi:hypothetical protein